jgi:hypothetical protein
VDEQPQCPRCGERRLARRASRSWSHSRASTATSQDDASFGTDWASPDPSWGDPYADELSADEDFEPMEFARQAREMAAMSGEPLDRDFDQALRYVESGADPEDVFGEMDAREADANGDMDESTGT